MAKSDLSALFYRPKWRRTSFGDRVRVWRLRANAHVIVERSNSCAGVALPVMFRVVDCFGGTTAEPRSVRIVSRHRKLAAALRQAVSLGRSKNLPR